MSNLIERELTVIVILVQIAMLFGLIILMRWKQQRRVRVVLREDGSLLELEAANPTDFKAALELVNEGEK
jgi:hypothetical protein